uniref:Uncharacterized protein n=1 Tax=Timema cristinae TaxID=61476 RepID=A0A7R9H951_TIMCR|nr:unnamed protein product [Timema cristinae]
MYAPENSRTSVSGSLVMDNIRLLKRLPKPFQEWHFTPTTTLLYGKTQSTEYGTMMGCRGEENHASRLERGLSISWSVVLFGQLCFDGPVECVVEPAADGVGTIGSLFLDFWLHKLHSYLDDMFQCNSGIILSSDETYLVDDDFPEEDGDVDDGKDEEIFEGDEEAQGECFQYPNPNLAGTFFCDLCVLVKVHGTYNHHLLVDQVSAHDSLKRQNENRASDTWRENNKPRGVQVKVHGTYNHHLLVDQVSAHESLSQNAELKTAPATLGGKTIDLEGSRYFLVASKSEERPALVRWRSQADITAALRAREKLTAGQYRERANLVL